MTPSRPAGDRNCRLLRRTRGDANNRRPGASNGRTEAMEQKAVGMNRPLADVTVLDFGQIYQGPYASLLLAKAGAFVIKIEPPAGEPGRRRAEPPKSTTLPFAMLNSNKRAITLNLKQARG